jgi:hypothetical protein
MTGSRPGGGHRHLSPETDGDHHFPDPGNQGLPPCQACGKPADDDQVPGLCRDCAVRIDRDYEWLRDLAELEAGP